MFPISFVGSNEYSLPIVTTFEGGIEDIVKDEVTGFLVAQRNTKDLADKLEILIQNPELRRQIGASGRRIYKQKFTLEIFENRLKEILQLVIEKK